MVSLRGFDFFLDAFSFPTAAAQRFVTLIVPHEALPASKEEQLLRRTRETRFVQETCSPFLPVIHSRLRGREAELDLGQEELRPIAFIEFDQPCTTKKTIPSEVDGLADPRTRHIGLKLRQIFEGEARGIGQMDGALDLHRVSPPYSDKADHQLFHRVEDRLTGSW